MNDFAKDRDWAYPSFVVTVEERIRWRVCRGYAEAAAAQDGDDAATTIHFMTRSLYRSDLPTGTQEEIAALLADEA
ncbi:MAG: hypothetical protein ACR2LK_06550 [Solirubrobacteraceae bacterium]